MADTLPTPTTFIPGPTPCYFMVVDILGFTEIIKNLGHDEQNQRIQDWLELVKSIKTEVGVQITQVISDTLFVKEEDSVEGLARLLHFAKLLLERGLEKNFPLRGSIVHGDVAWGNLTYGEAVIEGHRIERALDWIGIACGPDLPGIDQMWDWDRVVVYPVPKKSGIVRLYPAVAWKVPETDELLRGSIGQGLIAEGDSIPWETISKLERTIQFRIYLRLGKLSGWDPQHYKGFFPMHIIDAVSALPHPEMLPKL